MSRVLILATTTGYQTRAFGDAAVRLGVDLVFATDRCHVIEDPWQDDAIPIRFYDEDTSVAAIVEAARQQPIDGVIAVGDRPTVIAARVADALGLSFHSPAAAAIARDKRRTRECLRDASLPVPWFLPFDTRNANPESRLPAGETRMPTPLAYPCVLKPVALSGSRGVMRVDDDDALAAALDRLRAIVESPDVRAERNDVHAFALLEGFIPGREYALEGLMHQGALQVLAVFDKPDPLDGPFFEETVYVTPSAAPDRTHAAIVEAVTRAAAAIGLDHGPIHAECRVNAEGVFVLEVAARPIGGLCARALRFVPDGTRDSGLGTRLPNPDSRIPLEELLLRHALGENPVRYRRENAASGVMMIPIPRSGLFRGVDGVEAARGVPHIADVQITAKPDQRLLPLPEGASYLGFIFARAGRAADVEAALRAAHARLRFAIDPEFRVLDAAHMHYNRHHG
jgi:ATP-grasp domain/L-amino acid ligase C-terminal domain 2/ATP-grasp N-terminal domain